MATTSTGTRTIEDSELLAQQIEQQQRAATATALSGTGGRGNLPPQGGGRGGPPAGGGGNPAGGGGGGGNPGGGGGGGNPPGGGGQPNQGQQNPPPNPADGKILGVTPLAFTGDRARAEEFMDAIEDHFLLNHQFTPYHSALTRIAYTLSLVQGPEVNSWRRLMRNWVLTQPDNRDTYNQFIMQFRAQFLDSGKALRARNKLRSLKMNWPHIDQYIADFEQLVDDGEYDKNHAECIQQFLTGLSRSVLDSVLKATHSVANPTYQQYRDMAVNITKSEQIFKALTGGGQTANHFFQNRQFDNRPRQSYQNFQQYPPRNNWNTPRNQGRPQYNSSNAPRNMNNSTVPMDLNRSRTNRYQGRSYRANPTYGRLMEVGDPNRQYPQDGPPRTRGPCFNCGQEGHFARNCPQRNAQGGRRDRRTSANLIDFNDDDTSSTTFGPSYMTEQTPLSKYDTIQNQIAHMTKEEMEELTSKFGAQDFQEA